MQDWFIPSGGTSDVYNSLVDSLCTLHCFSQHPLKVGQQAPRSGQFMAGIINHSPFIFTNYAEYLSVKLTKPLKTGEKYYAEMYVSLADESAVASNNLGMYFSDTLINYPSTHYTYLDYSPQIKESTIISDTLNWVKISGYFQAQKAEEYLLIGNFLGDTLTNSSTLNIGRLMLSYYYIDDILVKQISVGAPADTIICSGDSIDLKATGDSILGWAVDSAPQQILSQQRRIRVAPRKRTTYLIYGKQDSARVTVDIYPEVSFSLGADTILCQGDTLSLFANLANENFQWQDGSKDTVYKVIEAGLYWLSLNHPCGIVSDTVQIEFYDCSPTLSMPNFFSPNNDGLNDYFYPYLSADGLQGEMIILNRWGQVLYRGPLDSEGWDGRHQGKECSDGVYFWKVRYRNHSNDLIEEKGHLSLKR